MKTALYQHLSQDYVSSVVKKWSPVLEKGGKLKSEAIRASTALVLENAQREFEDQGLVPMNESFTGAINHTGGVGGAAGVGAPLGNYAGANAYGPNDARIPTIVIPTIRRIFPELIAHELFGVQPMNGPLGFAFALRAKYGVNGKNGDKENTEIGYNTIDSGFTGVSGMVEQDASGNYAVLPAGVGAASQANSMWTAFAGAPASVDANGMADSLANQEWLNVGEDMPMAKLGLEKGVVEARSRKLAAHWSLELAEDMKTMHGLDVDNEMVNILSYEVKAEIDRQILGQGVKAAVNAGSTSTWSPVSADGRNQMERIGTLYTHLLLKAQLIAKLTRRGAANWLVGSPTSMALLERLGDFAFDKAGSGVDSLEKATGGVVKVGTFRGGSIAAYRDSYAGGDYVMLGFKGASEYDAGMIFCPYIPLQLMRAVDQGTFGPRLGVRTRYGILDHLFGSGYYYQFIKLDGLASTALASDGGRIFTA